MDLIYTHDNVVIVLFTSNALASNDASLSPISQLTRLSLSME